MAVRQLRAPEHMGPFPPRIVRPRWKRPRYLILGTVVVLAVAGLVSIPVAHPFACGGPGSGVALIDGECIGVTDGDYVFQPEFADVEAKIAAENEYATADDRAAITIGLLEPFTVHDYSALDADQVRDELEGAYTAQYRANHSQAVGDIRPMIRLVLANEGSTSAQWQPVTAQLEAMTDDSAPLVAVAGLGVSVRGTLDGAMDLSAHGLPMVGAVTTADMIDFSRVYGFVRVEPSDHEFVAALRQYLAGHPELNSSLVVYDHNADNGYDLYTKSLRDDLLALHPNLDSLTFGGVSAPSEANPDMFSNITTTICAAAPKLVLYAGREVDLVDFLDSLENRECRAAPLTIATGGTDLGDLATPATNRRLAAANLTVVYASSTDAAGWAKGVPGTPPHYQDFYQAFTSLHLNPVDLADGDAIATHDAVFTAVKAARLAYAAESGSNPPLPRPQDVVVELLNLNNRAEVVPAAAGDISFSYQGAATGDPENKPIPVLTLPPSAPGAGPVYTTRR